MAAYRRVYDSRHLQADCQVPDQLWNPTLGNRVWATFTFYLCVCSRSFMLFNIVDLTSYGQRQVFTPDNNLQGRNF